MATEVGIRELRADLSAWIKRVTAGEEVLITDRGKPVARITPATGNRKLDELIAAGHVRVAEDPHGPVPPPLDLGPGISLSDLILDERGR